MTPAEDNEQMSSMPGAPVRSKKSQRSKKPKKGQTRRKTKRGQPDLILEAIRTAPQPLTLEDLRQVPSVDRRRLTYNVSRLEKQHKIEKTPTGYVAMST